MYLFRIIVSFMMIIFAHNYVYAQISSFKLFGNILDEKGNPVPLANISIKETPFGTVSNDKGEYNLTVPADRKLTLVITMLGYKPEERVITGKEGENIGLDIVMRISFEEISEVLIYQDKYREGSLSRLNTRSLEFIPSIGNNIEILLKTLPGVSGRNEFSSQYSVRGGNFDENLVYINGIEIYRPLLLHSGQKEGLSFINSDLAGAVNFSAGGYSARYGDKMSSVLDITYREPSSFAVSGSASLLGASAHLEGVSSNKRFNHISGLRYKTNQYLLQTLDQKGDYISSFSDFQTFANYNLNSQLKFSFLGNYSRNNYGFFPDTRETSFGTFNNPMQLMVYYDGHDASVFETFFGSLSSHYKSVNKLNLHFNLSAFTTYESETFDIHGKYLINVIDRQLSQDNQSDSIMNIGVGSFLEHARNYLEASVISIVHSGNFVYKRNKFEWGSKLQHAFFDDQFREWQVIDSAGYNLPVSNTEINTFQLADADNKLTNRLFSSYFQNTTRITLRSSTVDFNSGIRGSYWSFNNRVHFSPRSSLTIHPGKFTNLVLHISGGYYYQIPFYRELRDRTGNINYDKIPQRSIHLVTGSDYFFSLWNRPFKFSAEFYYKWLYNMIPWNIDNIRIIYSDNNNARGYSTGIDFKLHGDFVSGMDSWVSLSLLQTRECVKYINTSGQMVISDFYSRPSDQLINFALFFQDYIPKNPTYKIHMKLMYASRVPFSPPDTAPYEVSFLMPSYRRVDLGFSKEISKRLKDPEKGHIAGNFRTLWIGAEIYNLLDVKNTISYLWLKTISNDPSYPGEFAIPNYLSGRRINIKLTAKF